MPTATQDRRRTAAAMDPGALSLERLAGRPVCDFHPGGAWALRGVAGNARLSAMLGRREQPAGTALGQSRDARSRAADVELFERLFDAHARELWRYCFSATADHASADDLVSAVFLEAWRRRGDVELSLDGARPWLYGVATNVIRNQRRALRRHRAALERLRSNAQSGAGTGPDAEQQLIDEARMTRVLQAVQRLPRAQREVVRLCVWGELPYADAAAVLGVPVGTVRSRLARARGTLRASALPVPSAKEECDELA
jgi:RNA polymerase sigma factor (sigma-70 family)